MAYDYKKGKTRIEEILNCNNSVITQDSLPSDSGFTFENAYYSWITSIFVDIRDSTSLFTKHDKLHVSKIIRSFTSEIIEILRGDNNIREIGIRGDCVYGIYTTPTQGDIYNIVCKSAEINTFIKMLNKSLSQNKLPNITVGIGVSTAQELVVKAGLKFSGINNKVWIGDAVTTASNLSSLANKNSYHEILLSDLTHYNITDDFIKNIGLHSMSWFTKFYDDNIKNFHGASLIIEDFNNWVENGMK